MVPRLRRKRRRPRAPSLAVHFRMGWPMRKIAAKFGIITANVYRIRDRGVIAAYASGCSMQQVAHQFGISIGRAYQIIDRDRPDSGSTWTAGSYDPSLNLVYFGTGGPIPHAAIVRGTGDGAVLFSDSTLALDVDTGTIVWYRQFLPDDNWNLDHTFEQVLVDIDVHQRPRQALIAIGKPGILWALDRRTGEFLWARETVYQNVFKSIDPETGKVTINDVWRWLIRARRRTVLRWRTVPGR
jgi:hypothetical protein